jgi:uroporphyrinogen-III decarboxylase
MSSFQFLEKELMSADEYDSYMYDPTDFVIRKIWPRIFKSLEPFEKLPPLRTTTDYVSLGPFGAFGDPDIQKALAAMMNTGKIIQKKVGGAVAFQQKLKDLGFPSLIGGGTLAPFDYIGDILRGTKGIMLDMFRMPNKVLDMIEKVYPMMLRNGMMAKAVGKPGVFIPLHKGLDGFMSPDQFKTFYWPTLKRLIEAFIAEDLIPMILWEGDCGSRLETIGDIPAGKAIYMFERTDMVKAKEILGDVVCLYGNVPISVLATGTTDDVKAICKRLIDEVGKGGGFIMAPSTNLDDAKPENVKAMIEFTKGYGVYT